MGCSLNERTANFIVFRCGHLRLHIRPPTSISLESTGHHQPNGAGCVFIRCMVFQIQLFLIHGFWNVVAPCLHGVGLHKSRKNSCSSKTTQRIKTRLVPLHWQGPVHSIDTSIVDLVCSRGCPQRKTTKICCMFIEGATHSTYKRHTSALKTAMATNFRHAASGSCHFLMVQKSCQKMLHRRNRKRCPKICDS